MFKDRKNGAMVSYTDSHNFYKYVSNGDYKNVRHVIGSGYSDVNSSIYHDWKLPRPLLIAIKNIQEKNDDFFKTAQMLLDC